MNGRAKRRTTRAGRRAGQPAGLTREAILAAARVEFAAHGYGGARVDRIAADAGVNKAMLYYHFRSKAGLYHAAIAHMIEEAGGRARSIVASDLLPEEKLDAMVANIAERITAYPEMPAIMMREVAEGGRHLDTGMLQAISRLYQALSAIIVEGQRSGRFEPASPLLVYFTLIGPLVLFHGGSRVRKAMSRLQVPGDWECEPAALRAHLQKVLRRLLLKQPEIER